MARKVWKKRAESGRTTRPPDPGPSRGPEATSITAVDVLPLDGCEPVQFYTVAESYEQEDTDPENPTERREPPSIDELSSQAFARFPAVAVQHQSIISSIMEESPGFTEASVPHLAMTTVTTHQASLDDESANEISNNNESTKKKKKKKRRISNDGSSTSASAPSSSVMIAAAPPVTDQSPVVRIREYKEEEEEPEKEKEEECKSSLFHRSFFCFTGTVLFTCAIPAIITGLHTVTAPASQHVTASYASLLGTCPFNVTDVSNSLYSPPRHAFSGASLTFAGPLRYALEGQSSFVYSDGHSSFVFDEQLPVAVKTSVPEAASVLSVSTSTAQSGLATPTVFIGPSNRISSNTSSTVKPHIINTSTNRPRVSIVKPVRFRPAARVVAAAEHDTRFHDSQATTEQQGRVSDSRDRSEFIEDSRAELEEQATPQLAKLAKASRRFFRRVAHLKPRFSRANTYGDRNLLPNRWRVEIGPAFGFIMGLDATSEGFEEEESVAEKGARLDDGLVKQKIDRGYTTQLHKRMEQAINQRSQCSQDALKPIKRHSVRGSRQQAVRPKPLSYLYDRRNVHKRTCPLASDPKPQSQLQPVFTPTASSTLDNSPASPPISTVTLHRIASASFATYSRHTSRTPTPLESPFAAIVAALFRILLCIVGVFLTYPLWFAKQRKMSRLMKNAGHDINTSTHSAATSTDIVKDSPSNVNGHHINASAGLQEVPPCAAPIQDVKSTSLPKGIIAAEREVDSAAYVKPREKMVKKIGLLHKFALAVLAVVKRRAEPVQVVPPVLTVEGSARQNTVARQQFVTTQPSLAELDDDCASAGTLENDVQQEVVEQTRSVHAPMLAVEPIDNALPATPVEEHVGTDWVERDQDVEESLTNNDGLEEIPDAMGQPQHKKTRRGKRGGTDRVYNRLWAVKKRQEDAQRLVLVATN